MKHHFYVTTPIYYVNDEPHIGHAYTTILADVLARYSRMEGVRTFFLTGTDEHGQKVERAARAAGITPQEQADRTVVRFKALWKKLEITNDDFIRTTEERHKQVVRLVLQELYDRGEIYRAEYDGWYCTPCERFFTEKDLVEDLCPECHRPVERITETNYFFRMGRYRDWLVEYIREHPQFIQPDFRRNETLGFLQQELNDLCISRPKRRLGWGIELPFDSDFVTYVWFDALVNYISAIGYGVDEKRFRDWWPAVHLIGKDILTTHTVYWPTMLRALGLPMPRTIFAHGWWLVGRSKMSKSLGNVVNPMDMAEKYGVDAFRYFLMAEMALGQDAEFTEESFVRRYNTDLANDFGNLLRRVVSMIGRYRDGALPGPRNADEAAKLLNDPEVESLRAKLMLAVEGMERGLQEMRLDRGVAGVLSAVRATNRFVEHSRPWDLARSQKHAELDRVLYVAAESLRVTSGLLSPVMPEKMAALRRALGMKAVDPKMQELRSWGVLRAGMEVVDIGPLFPRVVTDDEKADGTASGRSGRSDRGRGKRKNSTSGGTKMENAREDESREAVVTYDDFSRIELRTAKVVEAERIEGTDKLLRLEVLMGEERRQLVAGIAQHYEPDDLIGKTIVVVANLKPAKIRGVESRGMLLAATRGENLRLLTVDGEIASGAQVR